MKGRRLLHHKLLGHQILMSQEYMYIKKTLSTYQLMECQLQMCGMTQKLVNTPLFCFQDLKLSTKDIIVVLKDTLNTTSNPLLIPNPHATWVPSNILERHSIDSRVVDGIHNLVISSSMAKLVGYPTPDSTFTY